MSWKPQIRMLHARFTVCAFLYGNVDDFNGPKADQNDHESYHLYKCQTRSWKADDFSLAA